MPTPLRLTQQFPAAPETVFALFGDPEFLAARVAATASAQTSAPKVGRQEWDEDAAVLATRQYVPSEALPSAIRSLVGAELTVDRGENWTRTSEGYLANWKVKISGAPAELHGTMTLGPHADGSQITVEGSAVVGIPFLGSKVEKVVIEQVAALLAKEETFTADWLRR